MTVPPLTSGIPGEIRPLPTGGTPPTGQEFTEVLVGPTSVEAVGAGFEWWLTPPQVEGMADNGGEPLFAAARPHVAPGDQAEGEESPPRIEEEPSDATGCLCLLTWPHREETAPLPPLPAPTGDGSHEGLPDAEAPAAATVLLEGTPGTIDSGRSGAESQGALWPLEMRKGGTGMPSTTFPQGAHSAPRSESSALLPSGEGFSLLPNTFTHSGATASERDSRSGTEERPVRSAGLSTSALTESESTLFTRSGSVATVATVGRMVSPVVETREAVVFPPHVPGTRFRSAEEIRGTPSLIPGTTISAEEFDAPAPRLPLPVASNADDIGMSSPMLPGASAGPSPDGAASAIPPPPPMLTGGSASAPFAADAIAHFGAAHSRITGDSRVASLPPLAVESGERLLQAPGEETPLSPATLSGASLPAERSGPTGSGVPSAARGNEPATLPPFSAPLGLPDVKEQVIHATLARMHIVRSFGEREFELRLTPPELGTLRVALRQTRHGLVVRVQAEEVATFQLLEAARAEILAALDHQQPGGMELSLEARSDGRTKPELEPHFSEDVRTPAARKTTAPVRAPPPAELGFLA